MSVTPYDLKRISDHLGESKLVDEASKDAIARVLMTLLVPQRPETIDYQIGETVRASAVIGYYTSVWRARERRQEVVLSSTKASVAKTFRAAMKTAGEKTTEAQVNEHLAMDPQVLVESEKLGDTTEVADILESVRYAVKNHHDGLLEQSRNERRTLGS